MRPILKPALQANWDDFRFFLAAAALSSFSKTAKELRVTQSTVSRRIETLERQLGVRLFDRLPSGVALTSEGETVFEAVRQIEGAVVGVQRRVLGSDERLEGPVRISLNDGFATYWFAPRLAELQELHPRITVEFQCSVEPTDLLNMESDISIRLREPEVPDLVAARLGTLHSVPCASPAYLERHGTPATPEDLLHHCLLDHEYYHYNERDCAAWLDLLHAKDQGLYWTNSTSSLLSAVQNGLGIALAPTFLLESMEGLAPLDLGLRSRSGIWLAYHPNVKGAARVRAVIDWIKGLFDQKAWPWFRDEFYLPEPGSVTSLQSKKKPARIAAPPSGPPPLLGPRYGPGRPATEKAVARRSAL